MLRTLVPRAWLRTRPLARAAAAARRHRQPHMHRRGRVRARRRAGGGRCRTQMTARALRGQPLPQSSVPVRSGSVATETAAVPSCDWECARLRMVERAECSRVRRGEWIENVCGHSLVIVLALTTGAERSFAAPRCRLFHPAALFFTGRRLRPSQTAAPWPRPSPRQSRALFHAPNCARHVCRVRLAIDTAT